MRASICIAAAAMAFAMAPSAQATVFVYAGKLLGTNEVPAVVPSGRGYSVVWYDDAAHTLQVHVGFSHLVGTSVASHIHVRLPGAPTGGVATQLPVFTGFPLGVHAGTYDHTFDLTLAATWNPSFISGNGGTPAGAESAFGVALAEGRAYLNVHSSTSPSGEIRANLVPVPEPASWALMIGGFALVGTALRRRRLAVRFA